MHKTRGSMDKIGGSVTRALAAVHRLLLRLYPREFRQRFGGAMSRTFSDAIASRVAAEGTVSAGFWALRALLNTAVSGVAERRLLRRRRGRASASAARVRDLAQDVRFAARMARRRPSAALLSVVTLGVGIGAASAVFSIVDASLLRPLNLPDPSRLVSMLETKAGRISQVSFDNLRDWKQQASSFEAIAAFRPQTINLTGVADPTSVRGAFVSGDFFAVVAVPPARGRALGPADDRPDAPPAAVISHAVWQQHFAGRDDVVGRPIHLNNIVFTIAGVMPPGFYFPVDNARVWVPARFGTSALSRGARAFIAFGRLREGIEIDAARTQLNGIAASLASAYPDTNADSGVAVEPLHDYLTNDARRPLTIVFALALLLLATAAANVTSLQLGATAARRSEIAVRVALGAGRVRIVRQLFVEQLALALAGGAAGVLLAKRLVPLAVAHSPLDVFGLYRAELDLRVVVFAAAATLGAGALSALVPALHWAAQMPAGALGGGARSAGDRRLTRWRAWLVAGQVAMAAILLTTGGLLVKSYLAMAAVEPGFTGADQLLTMEYRLPQNRYNTSARQLSAHEAILEQISTVPGVRRTALVRALPFSGNGSVVSYAASEAPGAELRSAEFNTITDEYFAVMRIPILEGRTFDDRDGADSPPVIVVSRSFAEQAWPGERPVGREIVISGFPLRPTVIGVVGDVRHRTLAEASSPAFYARASQSPGIFMTIVAETAGDPMTHVQAVKRAVWDVDPDQPLWKYRTLGSLVEGSLQPLRSMFGALSIFAAAALLLVVAGLYGVMSQSVGQRVREIGVRMALGADRSSVVRDVLRRGLRVTGIGLAAGVIGATWIAGLLRDMLFTVSPFDPVPYVIAAVVLGALAAGSCYLPARRAASIDPTVTLRA
jgi:putative ABC transport system permease protein